MTDIGGTQHEAEVLARITAETDAAHEKAVSAERWRHEVESVTGTGRAEGGHVRAVVDVQGMLTGLVVGDVVASRGGRVVTAAVRTALRAAQEDVRRRAVESAEAAWGPGSATATAFGAEVERATPLVEAGEPGGGPEHPGAGPGRPAGPSTNGGTW